MLSDDELWPGADARWLSVAPAGAETADYVLYKFDSHWEHYRGTFKKSQSMTLQCEDIDETYRIYKERGVEFLKESRIRRFWGRLRFDEGLRGQYWLILAQV